MGAWQPISEGRLRFPWRMQADISIHVGDFDSLEFHCEIGSSLSREFTPRVILKVHALLRLIFDLNAAVLLQKRSAIKTDWETKRFTTILLSQWSSSLNSVLWFRPLQCRMSRDN